jgi:predicted Na+-dependent transporter
MGAAALGYRLLHAIHFHPVGPWVPTLLMLIMFGMGVHLKVDDFKRVLSRPAPVAAGIFLHYLVMPSPPGCWR